MNAAAGGRHSLRDVMEIIGQVTGNPLEAEWQQPRVGDVKDSWAEIEKARRILGVEPQVSLRAGLESTIEWMRGLDPVR